MDQKFGDNKIYIIQTFDKSPNLEVGTVSKIFHIISCLQMHDENFACNEKKIHLIPPTLSLTLLFIVLDLAITKGSGLLLSLIMLTD